jgi:hypothetical protein
LGSGIGCWETKKGSVFAFPTRDYRCEVGRSNAVSARELIAWAVPGSATAEDILLQTVADLCGREPIGYVPLPTNIGIVLIERPTLRIRLTPLPLTKRRLAIPIIRVIDGAPVGDDAVRGLGACPRAAGVLRGIWIGPARRQAADTGIVQRERPALSVALATFPLTETASAIPVVGVVDGAPVYDDAV